MKAVKEFLKDCVTWLSKSHKQSWECYLEDSVDIYELEYRQKQLDREERNSNYSFKTF